MKFPLIQNQAKNGKDWIEQREKTSNSWTFREQAKELNFLMKGQYNC